MKGCQSPNLKKPDKQGVQQSFRSPAMQKRPRSMTTTRQALVAPSNHATSSSNSSRVAVTQTSAYSFTYQSSYLPSPMPAWSVHQTTHFSASTPAFSNRKLLWVTADESSQFFTSKTSNRRDLKNQKTLTPVCQKRLSKAKSVDEHLSCAKM